MNILVFTSSSEIEDDPKKLIEAMRAHNIIRVRDLGYAILPASYVPYDAGDYDETQDMASLRTERTGVDNTVFVSPKGRAQHGPRIKIAVDPPKSFDPTAKTASMAINAEYTVEGDLPSHIEKQAKRFIELNREALLLYWSSAIDTDELLKRLKRID
jgi:hypothetical protein